MPEDPLSSRALYVARPTIRINGRESERVTTLLLALEMIEHEDGLSSLELRLSNVASTRDGASDFAFEDEAEFKLGDSIAVYCGEESAPIEVFRGIITALEADFPEQGSPALMLLAEDRLQKARIKRRTKTHTDLRLADLANSIASDLGLTPKVTGFSENIGTQVQLNESDLAFLRRLLARYDGDIQAVGTELHVSPRDDVRRGAIELGLHSQLRRVCVCADLAHQVNEVTITGWDPATGQRITGRSAGAHQGPGRGRVSTELLPSALGRRSHQISHLAVETTAEANSLAEAACDERLRRFVTVTACAEGNPKLRVGTHVTLAGLGPRFSNTYYLTRCCHRFDLERGYETDFTAESAYLGNS